MARYCFLVGLVLFIGSAQGENIRGTHWGMTMEEVKAVEKWEYVKQTEKLLYYVGELKPGITTKLIYEFNNGLLIGFTYSLDKSKSTYKFFRSILGEKYGRPHDERPERERVEQVRELKGYRQYKIAELADFVYADWRIHKEKDKPKTQLMLHHHSISNVRIVYANLEYLKQAEQLEKDKERDATYSLKNGNDL